jgi:hypothetical protein
MDPTPKPDPTSDPTPFFIDFKDANFFKNIFTGTSSSVLKIKFFAKISVQILFCSHYFSPLNTLMRKGKDPDPLL